MILYIITLIGYVGLCDRISLTFKLYVYLYMYSPAIPYILLISMKLFYTGLMTCIPLYIVCR